jgi:dihydrofolate reductase
VDEVQMFLVPAIVGGGKRALPDGVRADLALRDTRRFAGGVVYLRYQCA